MERRADGKGSSNPARIAAIVAIGLGLRLLFLGRSGFWHDELFSIHYARLPASFLWTEGLRIETNPPLYYWLLHYWMRIFGDSPFLVRLPSALLSTAAIWATYRLGRRISGTKAGLWAAGFCAFSAFQLFYAQEARSYALEALAACVALAGMDLFIEAHFRDGAPSAGPRARAAALYAAGCALAVHAHVTGVFLLPACTVGVAYAALERRRFDARAVRDWAGANLAALALAAPVLVPMLAQARSPNIVWIPKPTAAGLGEILSHLLLGTGFPSEWGRILAPAALASLALLAWRERLSLRERIAYAVVPAAFFALLVAVSFWRPLLIDRIVLWLAVPVCLLAARLAAGLEGARARRAFAAVAILLYGTGAWCFFRTETKEDWAGLSAGMRKAVDASYAPVFCPGSQPYDLLPYAPELVGREPLRVPLNPGGPLRAADRVSDFSVAARPAGGDEVARLIRAKTKLFLVMRYNDLGSCGARIVSLSRAPDEIVASRGATAYIWRSP